MSDDRMSKLKTFFTLQKIANYGPAPSIVIRQSSVKIFALPPTADGKPPVRIPNNVLGYAEPTDSAAQTALAKEMVPLLIMDF